MKIHSLGTILLALASPAFAAAPAAYRDCRAGLDQFRQRYDALLSQQSEDCRSVLSVSPRGFFGETLVFHKFDIACADSKQEITSLADEQARFCESKCAPLKLGFVSAICRNASVQGHPRLPKQGIEEFSEDVKELPENLPSRAECREGLHDVAKKYDAYAGKQSRTCANMLDRDVSEYHVTQWEKACKNFHRDYLPVFRAKSRLCLYGCAQLGDPSLNEACESDGLSRFRERMERLHAPASVPAEPGEESAPVSPSAI